MVTLSSPQADILESRQQVNLFLAGQGSGKTHLAGVISYLYLSQFPKLRGLIAANTYSQLTRSTLFRIREVWKQEFGVVEYDEKKKQGHYVVGKRPPRHFTVFYEFDSYNNIMCFAWGAVVYVGSLDNYKALDGMEIGWAMLDETKDTREVAVKEVIVGRLRQPGLYVNEAGELVGELTPTPFNPLYIFTSPAKVPWLNEWFSLDQFQAEIKATIYLPPQYFCKQVGNKLVTISASHLNRHNLPSNYIDNQFANVGKDKHGMLIYGDPFARAGGEFYKHFDRAKHVGKYAQLYDPTLPLHLSFDQNVVPYNTLTVHQIFGTKAVQLAEFCLGNPNNSTGKVCEALLRSRFGQHEGGVFVYGDPSGNKRDTRSEEGTNDYSIILKALAKLRPQSRVVTKAPPVAVRGEWINGVFERQLDGLEFLIDEGCTNTIGDLIYLKEAPDGTKLKEKVTDEATGVSFEKYGHCSDTLDYFYTSAFKEQWRRFHKKETVVLPDLILPNRSRNGY